MTMETTKEIKDYLYLYLGCEVVCIKSNYYLVHEKFIHKGDTVKVTGWLIDYLIIRDSNDIEVIFKPILRNLSDMQSKDLKEWVDLCISNKLIRKEPSEYEYENAAKYVRENGLNGIDFTENKFVPLNIVFLLAKHFDLFGLIESGLAIDKTKIKKIEV